MIQFQCPQCGKSWKLHDSSAEKNARCQCGATIKVPAAPTPPVANVSLHGCHCPGCGEAIKPNWRACPACGAQLSPKASATPAALRADPMPPADVQAGDNSVVKAEINKSVSVNAGPGEVAVPPMPRGPMIHVGADSVVKAEIDASYSVSAAGDIVGHKEVHTTHQETHIHQQESAAGAVMKNLRQLLNPQLLNRLQQDEDSINRDFREASNSDGSLFAIVTKQIAAIEALSVGEALAQARLTQARYSNSMHALEVIEQRNHNRPEVLALVNRKRAKLSTLLSSQRRRPFFFFVILVGPLFLVAIIILGFGLSRDSTVRQDVQTLIHKGKFDEARIRAQDIDGSDNVKRMIDAIDKAENSRKSPAGSSNPLQLSSSQPTNKKS